MAGKTKIEWASDEDGTPGMTWNPVRGCIKISPGCRNCYASTFAERWRGIAGHPYEQGFDPRTAPDQLDAPIHWRKPRTIFVNSMSDLFGEFVTDDYLRQVFGVMERADQHIYQILTKRSKRVPEFCNEYFAATSPDGETTIDPPQHIHVGVSVEDRKYGLPRIKDLQRARVGLRFLSIEPLLEDLGEIDLTGIHWVIVGGESGHGARPMHPAWVRRIREQCLAAKVPFFFKQWGAWEPRSRDDGRPFDTLAAGNRDRLVAIDGTVHCSHEAAREGAVPMSCVGKKHAGRLLDRRVWDERPAGCAAPRPEPAQRSLPVL